MRSKLLIVVGAALTLLLLVGVVVYVNPWQDSGPHPSGPNITSNGQVQAEPGDTVITLTWQPVPGAVGYMVYRDGNNTPLNPAPITTTNYSDIGLSNGRAYTYAIGVVGAGGKPGSRLAETKVSPKSR